MRWEFCVPRCVYGLYTLVSSRSEPQLMAGMQQGMRSEKELGSNFFCPRLRSPELCWGDKHLYCDRSMVIY